jgi:hypothetical protein
MPFMRKIITATLLGIVVVVATANFTLKKIGPSNLDIVVVKAPPLQKVGGFKDGPGKGTDGASLPEPDVGYLKEQAMFKETKDRVTRNMLDPEAAKFRNLRVISGDTVCGEVNPKNTYGAYIGYQKFMYTPGRTPVFEDPTDARMREAIGYMCHEFTLDAKGEPMLNPDYRR